MEVIEINTKTINLDQFLKWANLVSTGGEAKIVINAGEVKVNGEIENRRGRSLKADDIIEFNNEQYQITTS
ncbi:RNA-binding S4 domain-containing protein [Orenia marismortui]|uniref:RNA-binding S4 domain-containing protein n=1 Tax=Orenia marismortui TaxID=46469 RepID=UPI00037786C4|nr:RNA-binding S4 domain-containing protein [Orenia marismortui]